MKWPRALAAEILALPTREARAAALAEVPEHWRGLVRRHVEVAYERNHKNPDNRANPLATDATS